MIVEALYGPEDIREEEWPKPEPKAGEVRVQIKSVCIGEADTALFLNGGADFEKVPMPFLPGREASGIIDSIGSEVDGFNEGSPVVICPYIPCGKCEYCSSGKDNLCRKTRILGTPPEHGALADYVVAPAENVFPVEAKVSFAEIACIDSLARGIYASQTLGVGPETTVAIFGAGGLGLSCLIAAKTFGAKIIAATDRIVSRLIIAEKSGAENIINISKKEAAEEIMKLTNDKGVDAAFVTTGESLALTEALKSLAPGGKVAVLGNPVEEFWKMPSSVCSEKEITIKTIEHSKSSFFTAIEWLVQNKVDLSDMISHRVTWESTEEAFKKAADLDKGILKISLEPEEIEEPFFI